MCSPFGLSVVIFASAAIVEEMKATLTAKKALREAQARLYICTPPCPC